MEFPDDLRYTKEHEWLRLEDDGSTAVIGITDFAQQELGDIVFVEIEPVGTELNKDDVFGTVEAVKTVAELYMPVAGIVKAINPSLEDAPESVNEDPYGQGWMVKITVSEPDKLGELLSPEEYGKMVSD